MTNISLLCDCLRNNFFNNIITNDGVNNVNNINNNIIVTCLSQTDFNKLLQQEYPQFLYKFCGANFCCNCCCSNTTKTNTFKNLQIINKSEENRFEFDDEKNGTPIFPITVAPEAYVKIMIQYTI